MANPRTPTLPWDDTYPPLNLNFIPQMWEKYHFDPSLDHKDSIQSWCTHFQEAGKFYSQFAEDKLIFSHALNQRLEDGVFLELGAHDGLDKSNTKFFEDTLGFSKGILIEPHPETYKDLVANRPNCINVNCAVHPTLKEAELLISNQAPVSTLKDGGASEEFYKTWHPQYTHNPEMARSVTVPARRLGDILSEHQIEYIDLWTLDVEGCELSVLQSMDWSIPVGILCIESYHPSMEECRKILFKNGFEYRALIWGHGGTRCPNNEYYINPNYFRLPKFFGSLDFLGPIPQ